MVLLSQNSHKSYMLAHIDHLAWTGLGMISKIVSLDTALLLYCM